MLQRLSVRDIILIDKLDLSFDIGFAALTGETGAGKSILLDATALALGARGDAGLVRAGQAQGSVTAVFEVALTHPVLTKAREAEIETDGELIFKRTQYADGRTRGTINDTPVSTNIMRGIGELLVEIHGQHADRAMIEPETHRILLDSFAQASEEISTVKRTWNARRVALKTLDEAEKRLEKARADGDFLKSAVKELTKLKPEAGEDEKLAKARLKLQQSEKIAGDLNEANEIFQGSRSLIPDFTGTWRKLERRAATAPDLVNPIVTAMGEALDRLEDARSALQTALREADFDPRELNSIEERLFALRAAARKYTVPVEGLAALKDKYAFDLEALEKGESNLSKLSQQVAQTEVEYQKAAKALRVIRTKAASALNEAVMRELPPLKLERARFITTLSEIAPTETGIDAVEFWVETNPGTKPGPLFKIASGGELSRFLLALKVVLADQGSAPTLIFDEIDAGVGGAVADAIGERLSRLAQKVQVMCVTHAPQVAAKVARHFLIEKATLKGITGTSVRLLTQTEQIEEIARMLSGDKITSEARAAAISLMKA